MLGLDLIRRAVNRVAAALEGIADTLEAANANARRTLALDGPEVPALPAPVEAQAEPPRNGRRKVTAE